MILKKRFAAEKILDEVAHSQFPAATPQKSFGNFVLVKLIKDCTFMFDH